MTPAAELILAEIRKSGPISFSRFMEIALYHPQAGYYRTRDPFGKAGDFYTAEQMQPVFGRLIASYAAELGVSRVVELGAGRAEMAAAFDRFEYIPVEVGDPLPPSCEGLILANEFFDALPVDVVIRRGDALIERRVNESLQWCDGPPASPAQRRYIGKFLPDLADGQMIEVNTEAISWLDRIAQRADSARLLILDYGYTSRETLRFPQGTLMSYRSHRALEDVLSEPGERDITAHVCFSALSAHPAYRPVRLDSLANFLLRAGEKDRFEAALAGSPDAHRLQLKTLLFGMGEVFRVLELDRRKEESSG